MCLVLRTRKGFEISKWDHWNTGQHRIGLLAEITDELVSSSGGWVPTPADGGPLALPQRRVAGQNFRLCPVVPDCSYFPMDVEGCWVVEKLSCKKQFLSQQRLRRVKLAVSEYCPQVKWPKMESNSTQCCSMQQMVCKNPDFHSLHLYATNKATREEAFVTDMIQNLRGHLMAVMCCQVSVGTRRWKFCDVVIPLFQDWCSCSCWREQREEEKQLHSGEFIDVHIVQEYENLLVVERGDSIMESESLTLQKTTKIIKSKL